MAAPPNSDSGRTGGLRPARTRWNPRNHRLFGGQTLRCDCDGLRHLPLSSLRVWAKLIPWNLKQTTDNDSQRPSSITRLAPQSFDGLDSSRGIYCLFIHRHLQLYSASVGQASHWRLRNALSPCRRSFIASSTTARPMPCHSRESDRVVAA